MDSLLRSTLTVHEITMVGTSFNGAHLPIRKLWLVDLIIGCFLTRSNRS